MNIGKATLQLLASNGAISIISFVALIYFARELPSGQLGSYFLFQAAIGITSIPADLGILGAVEKRISENKAPEQLLTTAVLLISIPLAIIVFLITVFSAQVNTYLGNDLATLLAIGVFLYSMKKLAIKLLRGELRLAETALLELVTKITWAIGGGALVVMGFGVYALIYSLLVGYAIAFIWGMWIRSTSFGRPSKRQARSLIDYARYNVISSTGTYIYNWMDVAILGIFVSPSLVSAYEIAWRLSSILMLFGRSISTSLFPQVSAWDIRGGQDQIEQLLPRAIFFSLLFVIPGFFGISALAPELLALVFKPEYVVASLALIILSFERLFHSAHMVLGQTLNGINQPRLSAQAILASLSLNIALNFLLIPRYNIEGAAAATAISFTVNTLLHTYYLSKFIEIRVPIVELAWVTFSSLIMAGVLMLIREQIEIAGLSTLIAVIAIGVIIFVMITPLNKDARSTITREINELTN